VVPLLLWALGLSGGAMMVAAILGGLAYTNNLPGFGGSHGAANPPPSELAAPPPLTPAKKYSSANAKALGAALQKISQVLDREGTLVVREINTIANTPLATSPKQQIYETIGRLDRVRNLTHTVEILIWDDLLRGNPKFVDELDEIVQKRELMTSLEGAAKVYFEGLTTVVSLQGKIDAPGKVQLFQLLNPTRDAFRQAASDFESWVQQCKSRIDEKNKELL
jgi:hypothetical protein